MQEQKRIEALTAVYESLEKKFPEVAGHVYAELMLKLGEMGDAPEPEFSDRLKRMFALGCTWRKKDEIRRRGFLPRAPASDVIRQAASVRSVGPVTMKDAMQWALGALDSEERKIFELHYCKGKPLAEVAQTMGLSCVFVKRVHGEARNKLVRIFKREGGTAR